MHILVTRTLRGPRSTIFWSNTRVAVQHERSGELIVSVEYEAPIAEPLFRRMAVFQLARPAIQ
jgi:hypothetical protein